MLAIFKREFLAYFNSIIGYIFIAVIYFFSGLFFWATCLYSNNAELNGVFESILTIIMFIMPILTMRMITEDIKQKTDQALFTAPIRTISIAMGKYFSAVAVYLISISVLLVYGIVVSFFTVPDWTVILGSFVGLLLMGMALISIGMFISSLTESQIVAAVISYVVSILIMLIDGISGFFSNAILKKVFSYVSFSGHYRNFTMGILNLTDVTFFVSICILFVILTSYSLEKRKWN